jgi:hypothetical protein
MHLRTNRLLYVALAAAVLTPEALASAPRYKMVLDAATPEHGVKTVSLVENPAIQRGWVALSAAEATAKRVHLSTATEGAQRQVLTGPALLPGQEILRLDAQGNPFYITFDAATIEATARQFAAQGRHNSTNQDHAVGLSGNVVYESWIVTDPANDKAAALGLDVPAGTWMLSTHIPDSAYWLAEVVSGNKTGFSIEGLFDSEQLTLSAVAPAPIPVKKNWFTSLMTAMLSLGAEKAAEISLALGLETLADGRAVNIDDTTLAVTVVGEDGQPGEALPDGEYDLKSGGKLVVAEGKRTDGEGPAPVVEAAKEPAATDAPGATEGAPATAEERLTKVESAVTEILSILKKDAPAENPAAAPAAAKLTAEQLHLTAVMSLKLDAIELADGDKLTLNPVSKRLAKADGSLVESGYFAAADGSYFCVNTDQWFYQIDKQTYDSVYKLAAVELQLKNARATLPAAKAIQLHREEAAAPAVAAGTATQKIGLSATAHLRAMQAQ